MKMGVLYQVVDVKKRRRESPTRICHAFTYWRSLIREFRECQGREGRSDGKDRMDHRPVGKPGDIQDVLERSTLVQDGMLERTVRYSDDGHGRRKLRRHLRCQGLLKLLLLRLP